MKKCPICNKKVVENKDYIVNEKRLNKKNKKKKNKRYPYKKGGKRRTNEK